MSLPALGYSRTLAGCGASQPEQRDSRRNVPNRYSKEDLGTVRTSTHTTVRSTVRSTVSRVNLIQIELDNTCRVSDAWKLIQALLFVCLRDSIQYLLGFKKQPLLAFPEILQAGTQRNMHKLRLSKCTISSRSPESVYIYERPLPIPFASCLTEVQRVTTCPH